MENLPPVPKVSFNHCVILFCSSACNCLKRPSTAAPTKTYSETETNSSRKDYIQTLIGNQALSQPSMEVSSIHFDSYSEVDIISNSHPAHCSRKGQEQLQVSRTLVEIMEIYGNLFNSFRYSDPRVDLPEPAAISKPCQRPKRNS